jgi:hypothetical protein
MALPLELVERFPGQRVGGTVVDDYDLDRFGFGDRADRGVDRVRTIEAGHDDPDPRPVAHSASSA